MPWIIFDGIPFRGRDLTGRKFGRLTALRIGAIIVSGKLRKTHWICRCECGMESLVFMSNLVNAHTLSCGCLMRERLSDSKRTHGGSVGGKIEPLFNRHRQMMARCYSTRAPNFSDYGARGITVCDRWHDYANFREELIGGFEPHLSLDRINNNGNYEPGNVRWATARQQCNNRRSNVILALNGRSMSAAEWARELGISRACIIARRKMGWPDESTLTRPVKPNHRTLLATKIIV